MVDLAAPLTGDRLINSYYTLDGGGGSGEGRPGPDLAPVRRPGPGSGVDLGTGGLGDVRMEEKHLHCIA